jgi:hypothetical protein
MMAILVGGARLAAGAPPSTALNCRVRSCAGGLRGRRQPLDRVNLRSVRVYPRLFPDKVLTILLILIADIVQYVRVDDHLNSL